MTNKERYKDFCETEKEMPIFSKDWWLDSVCGKNNWDVIIVEKGGHIMATMPYYRIKSNRITKIVMPPLTQTMGIYLKYPKGQKYAKRISFEKDVINKVLDQLPSVAAFSQNFHHTFTNWLPLYWRGFKQTSRYTYFISRGVEKEEIFNNFSSNIKTDIKKGRSRVSIVESDNIGAFYKINMATFSRQNRKTPYSFDFIREIDDVFREKKCRKILLALDKQNNVHAGVYIVWDDSTVYYLMGGGDPNFRNSGATSLLLWEAIQFSVEKSLNFDFEGSMIEGVERFVRAFGGEQKQYFGISKTSSRLLKLITAFREIMK